MPVLRRPAARPSGLRLISKNIGTDNAGWTWTLTWRKGGRTLSYGNCFTDVLIERRRNGVAQKKKPCVNVGKSGDGRCELKCPRGLPRPWGGTNGSRRVLWARLLAWYFTRRPSGCTKAAFCPETGRSTWAIVLVTCYTRQQCAKTNNDFAYKSFTYHSRRLVKVFLECG